MLVSNLKSDKHTFSPRSAVSSCLTVVVGLLTHVLAGCWPVQVLRCFPLQRESPVSGNQACWLMLELGGKRSWKEHESSSGARIHFTQGRCGWRAFYWLTFPVQRVVQWTFRLIGDDGFLSSVILLKDCFVPTRSLEIILKHAPCACVIVPSGLGSLSILGCFRSERLLSSLPVGLPECASPVIFQVDWISGWVV